MPETKEKLPHWDISNVYSGLEAENFSLDIEKLKKLLDEMDEFIKARNVGKLESIPADIKPVAEAMDELIQELNEVAELAETMSAFVSAFYSTDSYDKVAAKRLSELEQVDIRIKRNYVRFQGWVGSLGFALDRICQIAPGAREHRLVLDEIVEQSKYLMEPQLEDLASQLMLAGGGSMWKLQGTVTSQIKMPFERDGKTQELPITVIRNLASDPDEAVRKRAYETELAGWDKVRESIAFSLNGVKGSAITMAKWRGREDVLHSSLDMNRIDRDTLNTLLECMKGSFPTFRRYLKSKAKKLGKDKLPWWDLFAPVGKARSTYTWDECAKYIVDQFGKFNGDLADLARRAFDNNWIDAEPRDGKRGGAFCMGVPSVEESRILTNFDGSFDQLTTVAHELGHAYHNHCQRGLPMLRRGAPMALAETASIFCETIVFNAAFDAASPEEQLPILENQLMGATQVIVDIYSRFLFESEVIKRRENGDLPVDELNEIIINAQKETYGDGLDQNYLHKYMWLLKPHYYYADLHFYNFPYAFGLLFGLGMYAIYLKEGQSFIPKYQELLRSTGEGKVASLAGRFGIDVKSKDFWNASLKILEERVDRYTKL
jgi:pepF/M3 family oligoendopeptidase